MAMKSCWPMGTSPRRAWAKTRWSSAPTATPCRRILDAVLQLIPLDQYVSQPAALMEVVPGDDVRPTIWEDYRALLAKHGEDPQAVEMMERFAFYERAKKAYAIVATGETAIYANVLLKKGVVQ